MRDLAADPPFAIRAVGITVASGAQSASSRGKPGAFGRMVRRVLGLKVPPGPMTATTGAEGLEDLSFEIAEGSAVSIAGPSGAANSALLRLLAGALPPTAGRIEMRGPVSSILDIGDNLDPAQTALQNIETLRRIRGIPAAAAKGFANEVLEFAELQGFAQVPVRKYSTGMQMRLSLALGLHGNPAVVLLDDVLGVGDGSFQHRCLERLRALKAAGTTIVMVTGDEALLQQLGACPLALSGGGFVVDSPSLDVAPSSEMEDGAAQFTWRISPHLPENDVAALADLKVSERRAGAENFLDLSFDCVAKVAPQRCRPLIHIMNGKATVLRSVYPTYLPAEHPGRLHVAVAVPVDLLPHGQYRIDVAMVSEREQIVHALKANAAVVLTVSRAVAATASHGARPLVSPALRWEIEPIAEAAP